MIAELDAVADRIDATGVAYEIRNGRIRLDCPACGKTGRRARRSVVISERLGGLISHASCGCQSVDIARALDLPPSALLSYRYSREASTRDDRGRTNAGGDSPGLHADAKPRGVTLELDKLLSTSTRGRRNVKCVRAVAADLDRVFARPGDWQAYSPRRAAAELGHDRTAIRRALRWLVEHNIIEERQLPPRDEKVVTEKGVETAKSGVKIYRPLTEEQQIKRLSRRAPASG